MLQDDTSTSVEMISRLYYSSVVAEVERHVEDRGSIRRQRRTIGASSTEWVARGPKDS